MNGTFAKKIAAVLVFAAVLVNFTFFTHSANAQATSSLLDARLSDIEKSINTEKNDWKGFKEILVTIKKSQTNVKDCDIESPLRLLYGHAALATGENTVAVEQFYCAADSNGSLSLRDWQDWTQKLVARNPNNASAHYFLGDAFARNGKLEQAKAEFDKALKLNPKHELVLNARGVVKWLLFESDTSKFAEYELEAVDDLSKVNEIKPQFADAWANRGIVGLRDESYLNRAIGFFDSSLNIDSSYWLVHNGKAVALGASGKYFEFKRDLSKIEMNASNTPFLDLNMGRFTASDKALKERGFTADLNFKLTIPIIKPLPALADISLNLHWDERGGIFMYLKEGENFIVADGGKPKYIGTWFALNYPPAQTQPSEGK